MVKFRVTARRVVTTGIMAGSVKLTMVGGAPDLAIGITGMFVSAWGFIPQKKEEPDHRPIYGPPAADPWADRGGKTPDAYRYGEYWHGNDESPRDGTEHEP
jgi:hypothetical protein